MRDSSLSEWPTWPRGTRPPPIANIVGYKVVGSYGSFVAEVAEIAMDDGRVTVPRVFAAMDWAVR